MRWLLVLGVLGLVLAATVTTVDDRGAGDAGGDVAPSPPTRSLAPKPAGFAPDEVRHRPGPMPAVPEGAVLVPARADAVEQLPGADDLPEEEFLKAD